MDKSTHFFGQSVFGQLISYLDTIDILQISRKHKADHYVKKFKSKDHLISMVFCVFSKCSSLREVSGALSPADFISCEKEIHLMEKDGRYFCGFAPISNRPARVN